MLNYKDAIEIIKQSTSNISLETESINILEIEGRVLAEDIYTDIDIPPFDNSAMDGFAINFDENIKDWEVFGEISAGNFKDYDIKDRYAVLITTGSKIPDSANCVIPIEDVEQVGNNIILKNYKSFKLGANIRIKGNDIQKERLTIEKFQTLSNKHVPILATCGKNKILVFKHVLTEIISTGDELIDISEFPEMDKIRSSNIYSLVSQARKNHLNAKFGGIFIDEKRILKMKFEEMLNSELQIIITTGGVSVGKYDIIKEILEELNAEILFWKVNIKPGKPILFAKYKNKLIFGLPGNPLSSFIGFEIFIKPLIEQIYSIDSNRLIYATLKNKITKKDGKMHFLLGNYQNTSAEISVNTEFSQNSGNLFHISKANCIVEFDEHLNEISIGEQVRCMII